MMTHPQPPQPSPELTDWQAARYGDSDATRAALAFYREREWKVDERYGKHDDLEARISAFKAGFDTARQQVEAQHAEEVKALRSNLAAVEQITDAEVADFRAQLATLQQTLTAREQETKRAVKLGVIEFHPQESLRKRFYAVTDDLTAAGCIVDLWLKDIATVLREFGYEMTITADKPLEITRLKGERA